MSEPLFHDNFAAALTGKMDGIESYLATPKHIERLRVYQNNVVSAQAEALVKAYPTVETLVGGEFMRATAVAFVKVHPPTNPVMALYGDGFAEFLDDFPPTQQLPYVGDIARLDRSWSESFFARNQNPLSPQDIARLGEIDLLGIAPGLHPSVRLTASKWNAHHIWKANRLVIEIKSGLQLVEKPTFAATWFGTKGVSDRELTRGQHDFLRALGESTNLDAALAVGRKHDREADLFSFFTEALTQGLIGQISQ